MRFLVWIPFSKGESINVRKKSVSVFHKKLLDFAEGSASKNLDWQKT